MCIVEMWGNYLLSYCWLFLQDPNSFPKQSKTTCCVLYFQFLVCVSVVYRDDGELITKSITEKLKVRNSNRRKYVVLCLMYFVVQC